jgi:PilZ domain
MEQKGDERRGADRRLKPRFNASLACSVALTDADRDILFPNEKLACTTRDLSETGVGLVAPSIYLGYTCVVDEGRALAVTLELPDGPVRMEAAAAHYLRADEGGETRYFIGLRINSMTGAHRSLYHSYLESLGKS